MSGAVKSVGGALGFNQSGTPQYQQYDMNKAMQMSNLGVQSDLGSTQMVQNPDGSYSTKFTSSANDQQRNNLMSNILGQMGDVSGADQFYNDASKRINKEFGDQRSSLDENLINRGIGVGNRQYENSMGTLADKQNQALNELATQSIFQGQQLDTNRINQANSLSSGRDIGQLAAMAALGQNNIYNDYMTQQNAHSDAKAAGNATQGSSLLGTIGGIAGSIFSDARLKENLISVGKLDNGLTVYLGNYKDYTGLDPRPQLFLVAQEVQDQIPDAVHEKDGFLMVDYKKATEV